MGTQAIRLKGNPLAKKIRKNIQAKVAARIDAGLSQPALATVLIGADPASQVYVRSKHRACEQAGMKSVGFELDADESLENALQVIRSLNERTDVHGILLQLPIPGHLDEEELLAAIDFHKDVDGLHPHNAGKLAQKGRQPLFFPATAYGILRLLEEESIDLQGKDVVILGRSNIVGMPMALMMIKANATVTVCHSRSKDIASICRHADVLIAAVGIPEFVKGDWIKPGAVVVDVGVNRVDDKSKEKGYRLAGDVDFSAAMKIAKAVTPVPGGVGPMTIAMLLENTLKAAELSDT